jgi:hypothetical protein
VHASECFSLQSFCGCQRKIAQMEKTACATQQMSYTGLFLEIIWSKSD